MGTNHLWERTICGNGPFVGTNHLSVERCKHTEFYGSFFFYLYCFLLPNVLFNGENCIQKVPLCLWYAPKILLKVLNFVDKRECKMAQRSNISRRNYKYQGVANLHAEYIQIIKKRKCRQCNPFPPVQLINKNIFVFRLVDRDKNNTIKKGFLFY